MFAAALEDSNPITQGKVLGFQSSAALWHECNAERRAQNEVFIGLADYQPYAANGNDFIADEIFSRDNMNVSCFGGQQPQTVAGSSKVRPATAGANPACRSKVALPARSAVVTYR